MAITFDRPEIITYNDFIERYTLPESNNKQDQQINIERWIIQASDYINSVCAGKPYKVYPDLIIKDQAGTITDDERFSAVCLQNAICGVVEYYIQTGHVFSDNQANVSGTSAFNILTRSDNADVEKLRLDILRQLNQGGWYRTTNLFDVEPSCYTRSSSSDEPSTLAELIKILNTYYLRCDGSNTPTPPYATFDLIDSNLKNVGNMTGTSNEISNFSVLKYFKLDNCSIDPSSLQDFQTRTDNNLQTTNKTIVGAINELARNSIITVNITPRDFGTITMPAGWSSLGFNVELPVDYNFEVLGVVSSSAYFSDENGRLFPTNVFRIEKTTNNEYNIFCDVMFYNNQNEALTGNLIFEAKLLIRKAN